MWFESLKKMKAASRLTTKEIAEQSGIPEPTLEKLFAGKTKEPKLPTMRKLVHFLGYTLDDLETENPTKKNSPSTAEAEPREEALLEFFRQLNEEGQDKVVDYVDDLVQSGKYIKSSKDPLAKEA